MFSSFAEISCYHFTTEPTSNSKRKQFRMIIRQYNIRPSITFSTQNLLLHTNTCNTYPVIIAPNKNTSYGINQSLSVKILFRPESHIHYYMRFTAVRYLIIINIKTDYLSYYYASFARTHTI